MRKIHKKINTKIREHGLKLKYTEKGPPSPFRPSFIHEQSRLKVIDNIYFPSLPDTYKVIHIHMHDIVTLISHHNESLINYLPLTGYDLKKDHITALVCLNYQR